jgi:hemerythrin-like domain-containing protein
MTEIIEILCREHRNMEKLLRVLERELGIFERGDRPDYDVLLGTIDYFKDYPDRLSSSEGGSDLPEAQGPRPRQSRIVWRS